MNRRAFLSVLSGSLLAAPLAAEAQRADPGTASLTEALTHAPVTETLTPTTGAETFSVSPYTMLALAASIPSNFSFWPDSGLGVLNHGDGTWSFFAASGENNPGTICRAVGNFTNLFAVSASQPPLTNYKAAPDAATGNLVSWQGGGPIYKDPASGLLIMFLHQERRFTNAAGYYSWSGLAKSTDGGASWKDCGATITPHVSYADLDTGPTYIVNDDWGQHFIADGYFYVYFPNNDYEIGAGSVAGQPIRGPGFCVARAPVAEVVAAAAAETVSVWRKYNAGTWTELGIRGVGTPVLDDSAHNYALGYSAYRGRYIMMAADEENPVGGPMAFIYCDSTDGITWSPITRFTGLDGFTQNPGDNQFKYWTMVDPTAADPTQLGQSFYLIGKRQAAPNDILRWTVTLTSNSPLGPSVSIEPGQTAFRGVG